MGDFESGVKSYISGYATVAVLFPVDEKGRADVSCNQCYYFRRNYKSCALNGEICNYPDRYVGAMCPLKIKDTEEEMEEK